MRPTTNLCAEVDVALADASEDLKRAFPPHPIDPTNAFAEWGGTYVDATAFRDRNARLIGVEAYLSLLWSVVDRISELAGRILCTEKGGALNEGLGPKLVSHFVQEDSRKEKTAMIFESIRQTFGWPIGVSHAIRNHFIHDGAQRHAEFFDGKTKQHAFRVSKEGWDLVEKRAKGYRVESTHIRPQAAWPTNPRADLLELLGACEREIDDALGVLVSSACTSYALHIGFMLSSD